ncbi:MAG: type II 3-dehydroquinate dehydratase [Candidatus Zixiibacteriota bacterium]
MPKILLVNGPNLNLLGKRSPEIYGSTSLDQLVAQLVEAAGAAGYDLLPFQSNHEGKIIDFIHREAGSAVGLIINPGALGHYSYALRDAIEAVGITAVEVHISDVHAREEFRHKLVLADMCAKQFIGMGVTGYHSALRWLIDRARPPVGDH